MLDESGVFGDLPVEVLNDIASRVTLMSVAAGTAVIRQGDIGDAYYLVRSGRLDVVEEHTDPTVAPRRLLRVCVRGEGFGETALLAAAPRDATVRPRTRTDLYRLDKGSFDRLLADHIEMGDSPATMQRRAELGALPAFAHLDDHELEMLLGHGTWLNVAPGYEIIRQGDTGDAFYVIASGHVDVDQDGVTVDAHGPGDHVGEVALLLDQPRNATVRATTPCRLFRLTRDGFEQLIGEQFRRGVILPAAEHRAWDH